MESYLSQEQIYTDSYNGTKTTLYGTKYSNVATVKITVIKQDGSDFTLAECRNAYKWLTGNPEANWMDLYIGDDVKYRLLCTIQDVKPQKLDARTVGLNIYCESLSPWAFSPVENITQSIDGNTVIEIDCPSDDLYTFVYPKTTYENTSGDSLIIENVTTGESTEITGLAVDEIITLDSNQLIVSDKPNKIFGNTFNFYWPRFKSGVNTLNISGTGSVAFEYYFPIKMGDCAQSINIASDSICDDSGNIQIDMLPFNRISDTPTDLKGYGITDAYTKSEIDDMFSNIDTYSKSEIDKKIDNITPAGIDIDEDALNAMLAKVLV